MLHMPSHIGRYEIKTLIGAGGMGSLYLARDTNPNTNRLVALKLLLANLDSGDLRERFAREARALAALNHPNIVDIYDSGEFQGFPYIVMEYVRGETLAETIKRRGPMTLGQKLRLMIELCSGLSHAHEAGIIHRDIKPANLMVDQYGRLKILDFGIARVSENLTRAGVQVTQLNMRIGTPGYMSPEQIEGLEIDRRSDLFAVGAVCYELISYHEAFSGATTRQIENKVLQSQPEPLTRLVADLDPEIEQIITRALAKDPKDRYQDAAALEQAFERLRWRLGPSETPIPAPARQTPDPTYVPSRKSRDSRADAAYRRSVALYSEGAHDAARRFAIEALAEDPEHEEARLFVVERFGAHVFPPLPGRTMQEYTSSGPTILRTDTHPAGTMTANAETVLSTAVHQSGSSAPARARTQSRWKKYQKPLQISGLMLAVIAIAAGSVFVAVWLLRPGPMLRVDRPAGGTLSGSGITCGSGGSDCSVQLTKGDLVQIHPEPDEGFVFVGFTGDCAPEGRLTMTGPKSCSATFEKVSVQKVAGMPLTIVRPEGGNVLTAGILCGSMDQDCEEEYPQGRLVKLTQQPDADYVFGGFTGDCSKDGLVTMNRAARCGAQFVRRRVAPPKTSPSAPPPPPVVSARSEGATGGGSPSRSPQPAAGGGASPGDAPSFRPEGTPGNTPLELPPKPEEPAKPAPSPEAIAKEDIAALLESYRKAYESLSLDQVKALYPQVPPSLGTAFSQYKSLEYVFTTDSKFVHLDPALGRATIERAAQLTPVYKGPGGGIQKIMNTFTLQRIDGTWRVVSVVAKPTK
jgi:serine/threonine protein kinase